MACVCVEEFFNLNVYIFKSSNTKVQGGIPGWLHTTYVSNELTVMWSCTPLTQCVAHNAERQVKLMAFDGLPYADII